MVILHLLVNATLSKKKKKILNELYVYLYIVKLVLNANIRVFNSHVEALNYTTYIL